MELGSLVKALPQLSGNAGHTVNQDAVMAVMQVLASEHRELMVSRKEAEIDKKEKELQVLIEAMEQKETKLRKLVDKLGRKDAA